MILLFISQSSEIKMLNERYQDKTHEILKKRKLSNETMLGRNVHKQTFLSFLNLVSPANSWRKKSSSLPN